MLIKVHCADCGHPLGTFALSGASDKTVAVHTCRCRPHIFDEADHPDPEAMQIAAADDAQGPPLDDGRRGLER